MRIKNLLILFLFIPLVGCGSVVSQLDPYYGELPCQNHDGKVQCMSLEQAYDYATGDKGGDFVYEDPVSSNKNSNWKHLALGTLGGAAIGAGIGALTAKADDKVVERSLPGGGKFYEIVKGSADKATAALVGAAIGGGAALVVTYLVDKILESKNKIDSKVLKGIYDRAEKYEKCIKDAARLEKQKGPKTAAEAAKKCGVILAGLPGVNLFDSKQISTLFKLRKEEQESVKKAISADIVNKNVVPLRTPPSIVRVLVTPWVDENDVFHQGETLFVVVNQGTWVIPGSHQVKMKKFLNPLTKEGDR